MLGPILFVLYVNDIPLYVNDIYIYMRDLDYIDEWSGIWQLGFNLEKCKCIHSGKQANPWKYTMWNGRENLVLKEVHEEKDQGVWCMCNLKCSKQCAEAARMATVVLINVKISFEELDAQSFQIIYKTYIRTHLEYAVQVWCPYYEEDIKTIENVQRKATKLVGLRNVAYEDRLRLLKIHSMRKRRLKGDLIESFKILNGYSKVDSNIFFQLNHSRQGHAFKLKKPRCNSKARQIFFCKELFINSWNSLDDKVVVNAISINTFKMV